MLLKNYDTYLGRCKLSLHFSERSSQFSNNSFEKLLSIWGKRFALPHGEKKTLFLPFVPESCCFGFCEGRKRRRGFDLVVFYGTRCHPKRRRTIWKGNNMVNQWFRKQYGESMIPTWYNIQQESKWWSTGWNIVQYEARIKVMNQYIIIVPKTTSLHFPNFAREIATCLHSNDRIISSSMVKYLCVIIRIKLV